MLRTFIAIEIEDPAVLKKLIEVKNYIAGVGAGIKPVEDENIHLTLRFLGEISQHSVEEVKRILTELKSIKRFNIRVKGVGAFPSITRPRVIWAGITEGAEELKRIRSIIDKAIVEHGLRDIKPDEHQFVPHITLARVKSSHLFAKLSTLISELQDEDFGVTPVTTIKLKRSILTPRGPIYHDLFNVTLA
ncbi:MAG: RNA 2',3'-cyclic phosphodiesterase [Thermoprotei archaeon]|nr:MAG: RNA 2',3'-cyclic phosphodiesterase [Thermoprotei archaeon]